MKISYRPFAMVLILALVLSGCQSLGINLGSSGSVLYKDDFSNPESGWDQMTGFDGESNYRDGRYRIFVNDVNKDIWANPGKEFTDVSIEVDATKGEGPDANEFGVTCRTTENHDFYFFIINSSGNFGIGKILNGEQSLLYLGPEEGSTEIQQGQATNHIRADCIGSTLTLYVNGEKLAEVQDADLTSGDVGLLAGTFNAQGVEIFFDNFVVKKP